MNLTRLPERPANWDEFIAKFDTKSLFHESCWLDHIVTSTEDYQDRYYVIEDNSAVVGYLCAIVSKRLCFSLMGSPMGGTGTNYMGPVVNRNVNQRRLVEAITAMNKSERIAHFEMCSELWDESILKDAGFDAHVRFTNKFDIPENEEEAFQNFSSSCRNKIRKAQKNGLVAEVVEDDSIVDDYFTQLKEVFGKQGMDVPYSKSRIAALLTRLREKNRIIPIRVTQNGETLATGFFPHCDRVMYAWGYASFLRCQKLAPNDLMISKAIKVAIDKNLREFNFCGGKSPFKSKFGGQDVEVKTFARSYFQPLKYLRNAYRRAHFARMKAKGLFVARSYEKKRRIG